MTATTRQATFLACYEAEPQILAEGIEGREAAEALKEKVRAVLTRELDSELI